ncbi:MAG: hypothetical protein CMP39_01430 [Rickettsiales bacterium]|nr:hypothetical protein [Rickettsiales bacterium]|tara:strand:- start:308 stop:595 length:288 start_codon:yes stop_codon:yes gene_type:complete
MPYAARSKNIGYAEKAAHSSKIKTRIFQANESSWVGSTPFKKENYILTKSKHFLFRDDCIHFSWLSPVTYTLFRFIRKILHLIFRKDITQILPSF